MAGIITRGDVIRALERDPSGAQLVLEAGTEALVVAYSDETLHTAMTKMLTNNIGRLPVVSHEQPPTLVGYLGRAEVMAARLRRHRDEHVREPGWFNRRTA